MEDNGRTLQFKFLQMQIPLAVFYPNAAVIITLFIIDHIEVEK